MHGNGAASVQNTKQATGTVAVKATYSSLLTPSITTTMESRSRDEIMQQIASQAANVRQNFEASSRKRQTTVSSATAAAALHMANLNKRRKLEQGIINYESDVGDGLPSLSSKGRQFHSAIASFTRPEPKKVIMAAPHVSDDGIKLKSYAGDIHVGPNDVIQGNGKTTQSLVGNKRYRVWIDLHSASFAKALSQDDRIHIATSVVNTVCGSKPPGRFLAMDITSGMWCEMPQESAVSMTMNVLHQAAGNASQVKHSTHHQAAQNTFVSRAA